MSDSFKIGFESVNYKEMKKTIKTAVIIVAVLCLSLLIYGSAIAVQKIFIYPIKYKEQVLTVSKEYNLDPALIFAVIKTESGFNEKAVSVKGAVGLMQITPKTAEYIAKKREIAKYDLYDPKTNIEFGTYYIRYLLDRFTGQKEAMAAYNAGEGTVKSWLKDERYSQDGKTLKDVPYKETERYIQKIGKSLERYKKLYQKLLDKS